MGNRGIQLSVFFVISLMLIATVFSSTAMAAPNDGKGGIGVLFTPSTSATTAPTAIVTTLPTDPQAEGSEVAAGSRYNIVQLTYSAFDTEKNEGINMAGGRLRIMFPDGWGDMTKFVKVEEFSSGTTLEANAGVGGVLYQTDKDGKLDGTVFDTSDKEDIANAAVSLSGSSITINLGSGWGRRSTTSDTRKSIRILFSRATAGKVKGAAEFTSSSSAKNGNLRLLGAHPSIPVGNILGSRTPTEHALDPDVHADPLNRALVVTPTKVYPGEKRKKITITFTAPGPMDKQTLELTIPQGFQPVNDAGTPEDASDDTSYLANTGVIPEAASIKVAARGGAKLVADDPAGTRNPRISADGVLQIDMATISEGQKIIVSYTMDIPPLFQADGTTAHPEAPTPVAASTKDTDTTFLASTGPTGETLLAVTTRKGGLVGNPMGAGKLEVKPFSLEQGSKGRGFTVTYTAFSNVTGSIMIEPAGILIDDLDPDDDVVTELQSDTPGAYGYVRTTTTSNKGGLNVTSDMITWENAALVAGDKVVIQISKVDVVDEPDNYEWETTVDTVKLVDDATTADVNEVGSLSVVKTSAETVKFDIDGESSFPAASEDKAIKFRFTAVDTPIRDGSVSFVIPAALGSAPVAPKGLTSAQKGAKGLRGIVGASGGTLAKDQPTVSGRTVTVSIKVLDVGASVVITYGTGGNKTLLHNVAGDVKIVGNFRTSTGSRPAGTATVKLTNVADGHAKAVVINPSQVEAGSNHGVISVKFTAIGTMDGGYVSLDLPSTGWGLMQRDPAQRNYVEISDNPNVTLELPTITESSSKAVAKIGKLGAGQSFTFVYGSGNGAMTNGAQVQDDLGIATFMIESDGDGDGIFAKITSEKERTSVEKQTNPDQLGTIFKMIGKQKGDGQLRVEVKAAADGTGEVEVTPMMVRAAASNVKLTFTYTSTQTIRDGELRFSVPAGWSKPQVSEAGEAGYTVVSGGGLGTAVAPDAASKRYITVPIVSITKDDTITIAYGDADDGRAMAPTEAGESVFGFAVRGTDDGALRSLSSGSPMVTVERQASGKAKSATAMISDSQGMLYAGQDGREITIVYTAAGQMIAGQVRLTIPAKATRVDGLGWSAPTMDNVDITVSSDGSHGDITYGGEELTPTQMVTVEDVNLMAGGMLTFVYTGKVQPTAKTGVAFKLETHGGLEADSFAGVSGPTPEDVMLTVDVGEAKAGSGMAEIADSDKVVEPSAAGETLTFTYTAVGEISYPREFRVRVPRDWSKPTNATTAPDNMGTYTVEHLSSGINQGNRIVEEIDPVDFDMVARVKAGVLHVHAGDQIVFTYQNATAPAEEGPSTFGVFFGGQTNDAQVGTGIKVFVQSESPSQLALSGADTVSADAGEKAAITVTLQDSAGMAAVMTTSVAVNLMSSSATGTFADEAGMAITVVDIPAGESAGMVYYMDSTAGTATIDATATGFTAAMSHEIMVTAATPDPEAVAITEGSIMVDPALAMAGDMVAVSAMGSAGQMATFSVGSIVSDMSMTETAGSYSGSFDVVVDLHADGMYDVSVTLNDDPTTTMTVEDALTIDSTDPMVTVTAPEDSVANGDTVMISATVTDASAIETVSVDVSMLDSTQTDPVTLEMGDDGYSASITISDENSHANGEKTITVTAMDAAGNSGSGEAMVMLTNTLSYTSMIPAGISLYHVPLDVADISTVADLKMKLGDAVNLVTVYDHATGSWNSRSDDVMITADLGLVLSMGSATPLTLEGEAWDGGASMISLQAGTNLIGLPVNDPRVTNVSDIASLFDEGVVTSVIRSTDDGFELVSDTMDSAVMGDAAYLVTASAAGTATLLGDGWTYEMASSAPIALAGYSVESQTPVLDVSGAIVDEITGLAREGFRVKVKNLSTKASLSRVTSVETAEGYNMTFVDLKAGHAARIGDILEISADSPSPLIGVKPVRHIVTVDDVKSGILALEELIAYEIPAETELLRNYPNPFNPETWIPYRLAEDADVSLTIYDVNGAMVRTIDIGHQSAAVYESRSKAIYWDGRNRFGEQVASGIYFYSLSAGDFSATRKMVILK